MKSFKEFMQLKSSKFRDPRMSSWWGVEEIKELRATVFLVSQLGWVISMMFFGAPFLNSLIISSLIDLACMGILSGISAYKEREYRLWQEARDNLVLTLNRLALNKTRKSHARKTRFED